MSSFLFEIYVSVNSKPDHPPGKPSGMFLKVQMPHPPGTKKVQTSDPLGQKISAKIPPQGQLFSKIQ